VSLLKKEKKTRMTPQRKVILEELCKVCTHPGADEIYRIVRRYLPRISLGTVYRNLEVLVDQGKIQKIESAGAMKRYDGNPEPHYHIRCVVCGKLDDAAIDTIREIDQAITAENDYVILGHRLEFRGVCPDCAQAKTTWNAGQPATIS
jgi:Fur family ferric uptake transcriptional regulator